MHTSADTRKHR